MLPPRWIPSAIQWQNYVQVWHAAPFGLFIRNTIIVTITSAIGQILSASLVAYGFSRFRFPGREVLFLMLVSTMILPGEVTLIPQFLLFRALRWLDSWKPLIVPSYFGGGAFSIFLFRQFFLSLPRDLDEAAMLDGAGTMRIFWTLLMPLSKPAIATVAIFSFASHWNSFLEPLIYLNTTEKFTVSLGLRFFQFVSPEVGSGARDHLYMAAALIVAFPCILLFVTMQKYFVRGVVLSGLKF